MKYKINNIEKFNSSKSLSTSTILSFMPVFRENKITLILSKEQSKTGFKVSTCEQKLATIQNSVRIPVKKCPVTQ